MREPAFPKCAYVSFFFPYFFFPYLFFTELFGLRIATCSFKSSTITDA